ncbi:unnamed protein product [Aphanomyces euteiches]|uniref:MYND-type domain-containing protein n=1 Tax=Aphanomyces euteiches TaxID=100861 RepID=A0A6G0XQ89_9STRA|nr:hypothetical protein Ae201684_002558 [Aphanomyces euteiches]
MTSLLAHLPHLEVRVHPTKGRSVHVAAKDGIQRGQSLFEEMPFGGVVLSTMTQKLCAVCYQEADPDITCDDCSQVAFCSSSCQAQLQDIHDLECCALEDLDLIAKKSSADKDLLRLLARILSTRVATPTVAAPTVFLPTAMSST